MTIDHFKSSFFLVTVAMTMKLTTMTGVEGAGKVIGKVNRCHCCLFAATGPSNIQVSLNDGSGAH